MICPRDHEQKTTLCKEHICISNFRSITK